MAEHKSSNNLENKQYQPAGPVSRPVDELVHYAHVLEAIIHGVTPDGYFSEEVLDSIREYVCPHWLDILQLN